MNTTKDIIYDSWRHIIIQTSVPGILLADLYGGLFILVVCGCPYLSASIHWDTLTPSHDIKGFTTLFNHPLPFIPAGGAGSIGVTGSKKLTKTSFSLFLISLVSFGFADPGMLVLTVVAQGPNLPFSKDLEMLTAEMVGRGGMGGTGGIGLWRLSGTGGGGEGPAALSPCPVAGAARGLTNGVVGIVPNTV